MRTCYIWFFNLLMLFHIFNSHYVKFLTHLLIIFWQFYLEEVKGNIDYQGYIFPRRRGSIVSNCLC
jgi:hypothetical protein